MISSYLAVINPVALELGPLKIHWYGIIMGTAVLLGLLLAIREGKRRGVKEDDLIDLVFWVIPAAIIGARLYYVLFEWSYYKDHLSEIIAIWNGGLAIHGGLIGAIVVGYWYVKRKNISFLKVADIIAPSIILGQAIGRWGNFLNQEAHGGEVGRNFLESLHLPNFIIDQMQINGIYYHPTFLYESIWNLVGFILLLMMRRFNPKRGEIFFTYFAWYSLGRFFIEGLRTDSLTFTGPGWLESILNGLWSPMQVMFTAGGMDSGNIRVAQFISLLLMLGAIFMIVWRRARGIAKESYRDPDQVREQLIEG
ncbi:prolipoprotein diacylglyceryl transferase [Thermoactinomyces sp. DSM 45892]|uniref:prolipoprotein diacylglyceryl transferase n=1 Tax=Thermoactinomyces sp. DSM 45892 TaxID=1882753 RepID=UPI00089C9648|nr:prolipoprotein diacylglyceryl transferase [Thermoactinomyces sp. DSM 45892]SDZ33977.1 Prolipoprotein diacylglyceryl transferase [Thermoactinomyces sp. DSM 45892]